MRTAFVHPTGLRSASTMCGLAVLLAMASPSGQACVAPDKLFEGTAVARLAALPNDAKTPALQLRSLDGVLRLFKLPSNVDQVAPGALVGLCYTPGREPYAVKDPAEIRGATVVGAVQRASGDKHKAWLVVRGRALPARPTGTASWTLKDAAEAAPVGQDGDLSMSLVVQEDLRVIAGAAQVGDRVHAVFREAADQSASSPTMRQLEWQAVEDQGLVAGGLLAASALFLLALAWQFTGYRTSTLFLGQDNRYSTSKFQAVLWFWMVLSAYLAVTAQRLIMAGPSYIGGVDIPRNLLMLSGISMLGFAASKAITASKVAAGKAEPTNNNSDGGKPPAVTAKVGDLVSDDFNRTDLGDFQIVVITGVAVVVYAISVVDFMSTFQFKRSISLPEIDAVLLAIFGLGQAGYLGKKAAGETGSGMTAQQAVQRAADLVASIRLNSAAVATADDAASAQKVISNTALDAAKATSSISAAAAAATKAQTAAMAARAAADSAGIAAKRVADGLAESSSMASDWSQDETVAAGTRSSLQAADVESKRAAARADHAKRIADGAEADAVETQAQVATKTQP